MVPSSAASTSAPARQLAHRWPRRQAAPLTSAGAGPLGVLGEQVDRHAFAVHEDGAQLRLGSRQGARYRSASLDSRWAIPVGVDRPRRRRTTTSRQRADQHDAGRDCQGARWFPHGSSRIRRANRGDTAARSPMDCGSGQSIGGRSPVSPNVDLFSAVDRANDAALVAGLAVGDEQAATAFVRRFQAPVYGLALSITSDEWLAQDVAQEVFAKAWRASATFDPRRASVLTWLLTITRNAAIDAVRGRRATPIEPEQLDDLLSATLAAAGPEDDGGGAVAARWWLLVRCGAMPREQARAVVLSVVGGRTSRRDQPARGNPAGHRQDTHTDRSAASSARDGGRP